MNPEIDPTDGMISRSALASHLLVNRMIELSRNFYSAEWISGLEFDVWDMAFENKKLFGSIEVTDRMAKLFRDLATLSDGWWVFEDKDQPEEDGPVFIPMHRWKQILSEHNSR